ncbi:MAG: DNA alkylation repair protein [Bacteroidota bacterium]|nr:DNA alkylation repair protein [Bacteroidota bacterium]
MSSKKTHFVKFVYFRSDTKYAIDTQRNYPSEAEILGIRVPKLRKVMGELRADYKTAENSVKPELAKELSKSNILECIQLAYLYLDKERKVLKMMTAQDVFDLGNYLDNWVLIDSYATIVVGTAWRENIISTKQIIEGLKSENVWTRRISVVATVALNQAARGGKGDTPRTLKICRLAIDDHEDMIVKGVSWALRVLVKPDKEAVLNFINRHESRIHNRVVREVKNKIFTGYKN